MGMALYVNFGVLVVDMLEITYPSLPIAKKQSEMLPVIELQNAFLAMTFTSFVPPPLFIHFKFKHRT